MKRAIDIYTIRLFKENIVYVLLFVIFLVMLGVFLPRQLSNYSELSQKKEKINQELSNLRTKKITVLSFTAGEIDELVKVLNRLIPNNEDYFSLFTTIENLSLSSGFAINSYKTVLPDSPKEELSVTINGEGSMNSLFDFLEKYHFGGGRLITVKEVKLTPNNLSIVTLQLTFYSKDFKSTNADFTTVDSSTVKSLKQISSGLEAIAANQDSSVPQPNYPVRSDPFQ